MELPIELKQLEPVRGALEILRYLYTKPKYIADGDEIMDDLDLSARGWDKAKRRLVTRNYIQMRSDYTYELTRKGVQSAETLKQYDAEGGGGSSSKLQRQVVLALPRNLVLGQTSPLKIGIEPNDDFADETSLVMRLSTRYADLGEWNEMVTLGSDALIVETTIKPQMYNQARIKLEVFQFAPNGDDMSVCGGLYVDVAVLESGATGEMIGYGANLEFD